MNQENNTCQDEISLVDLATIFVRRIWLFIVLFVLFVVGGVVFALLQDEQYEYVSLYQVAEMGADKPVEKPAKAIAVLQSQRLPELEAAYKAEHGERAPFKASFSNPDDTNLVRISSEAVKDSAEQVREFHKELLDHLKDRHEKQIVDARNKIETRLDSVVRTLDALKQTPEAGQAVAEVMQKQVELEGELASLSSGELMVVGRESIERVAPNRALIVVLASVLGFIFAFMAVYCAEFASEVRKTLREQNRG